jgi:hypothetical protein
VAANPVTPITRFNPSPVFRSAIAIYNQAIKI